MRRHRVRVGAARLHTVESGRRRTKHGPDLVFLHAGVADHRSWLGTFERLERGDAPHHLVAYDRRGFGDTRARAEPHAHVDDLRAVLDATCTRPVVLVGNSQGGRIALDLTLAEPERVRALFLVAPAVSGAPPVEPLPEALQPLADAISAADEAGDLEALNELEAHLWLDGPLAPRGRVQGPVRELFLDMNGRALRAPDPGEANEPPSAWSRLGSVPVPTHVVVGDLDVPWAPERCHVLGERIPGAEVSVMHGTAHLPQLEQPEAFVALLERFLARIAG